MSLSGYPNVDPSLLMDFANSAQLNSRFLANRASTATVMGINGLIGGVASNIPRFQYNQTTGACEGYLIESQRTNLCTYSEDLANANFRKYNGTVTVNAAVAPDGATTADFYQGTGVNPLSMDTYPNDYGSNQDVVQTFSVYAKANGVNTIRLHIGGDTTGPVFNLATGAITPFAGFTAEIQTLPNGWYRVSATSIKSNQFWYWGATFNPGASVPSGSGMFVWGWTIENGSFASSYIPTAASTVTRAADIPYIDSGEFFTSRGGTLLFEGSPREDGSNSTGAFMTGYFSGATERLMLVADNAGTNINARYGATTLSLGSLPSTPTAMKLITTFDPTNLAGCRNGGTVQTTTGSFAAGANRFFIGNTFFGSGAYTAMNGVLKKVAYWPSRLTNAQLQQLTA